LKHGHAVFEVFGVDGTGPVVVDLFLNLHLVLVHAFISLSLVDLSRHTGLFWIDAAHDGGVGVEVLRIVALPSL
jgi:hypothetical protein